MAKAKTTTGVKKPRTKPQQQSKPKRDKTQRATSIVVKEPNPQSTLSSVGQNIGGALGSLGGHLLSRLTGFGTYEVEKNSVSEGNAVPSFTSQGNGVTVCHREYITDISGSVLFTNTSYAVQPGLGSSFPWLSDLASGFEEYEILGLVYEFKTTSGMYSAASTALGAVIMATTYNVLEPLFTNKQTMESYEYSVSTVPSASILHPVECQPFNNVTNTWFTRTAAAPTNLNQLYDMGNFQIATVGMPIVSVIGELWVSYEVRLKKPRIAFFSPGDFLHMVNTTAATCTAASPLSPAMTMRVGSDLTGFVYVSGTTFRLQNPGTYQIVMNHQGATIAAAAGMTVGANITLGPLIYNNAAVATFSLSTAAQAHFISTYTVSTYGTGAANTFTVTTLTTLTIGNIDLIITGLLTSV